MTCDKCGAELLSGSSFCTECGSKIESVVTKPTPKKKGLFSKKEPASDKSDISAAGAADNPFSHEGGKDKALKLLGIFCISAASIVLVYYLIVYLHNKENVYYVSSVAAPVFLYIASAIYGFICRGRAIRAAAAVDARHIRGAGVFVCLLALTHFVITALFTFIKI